MSVTGQAPFRIEPLAAVQDRLGFKCGVESLDRYLKEQASQDVRRKANAVFVFVKESEPERICGYFTLCAGSLPPGTVPDAAKKFLPRYPAVSCTLLGRLAIDAAFQGQGIGGALLAEALRHAFENAAFVGSSMVVVDAFDERAASFYQAHGFLRFPESMRLGLPMIAIGKQLARLAL
jgi:GNAT superfamily N-acetyltransferase